MLGHQGFQNIARSRSVVASWLLTSTRISTLRPGWRLIYYENEIRKNVCLRVDCEYKSGVSSSMNVRIVDPGDDSSLKH